jgi:hypothetical protein
MIKAAATLDTALDLRARGYAPHWLRPHSKAPIDREWSVAPVKSAEALKASYRPAYNLGVRCGQYSTPVPAMGLVVIDTDIKVAAYATEAHAALAKLVGGDIEGPAVWSGRRNGSRHDWRSCPLDRLPPKAAVVVRKAERTWIPPEKKQPEPVWHIEVLSTGKQVVVPPSIHPTTGCRYEWITLPHSLPLLPESMYTAIDAALAASVRLNAHDDRQPSACQRPSTGSRPGDDFNTRADWETLLLPHGWTLVHRRGEVSYWRRPGKTESGWSASVNYGGHDLLYCFSTAAPPFASETAYRKFTAYTLMEHRGDFRLAAKALWHLGYGERNTVSETSGRWPSRITVEVA